MCRSFGTSKVINVLIRQLHHEMAGVSVYCLCTLRNLSVTPQIVLEHGKSTHFHTGVRSFLIQQSDTAAQLGAAQLLLNMCDLRKIATFFVYRRTSASVFKTE